MIRLKSKDTLGKFPADTCVVDGCLQNANFLFSTESNVIDVCGEHLKILEAEKYTS